jgi:hypothetical protein
MVLGLFPVVDPPVVGRVVDAGSMVTVPNAPVESDTDRGCSLVGRAGASMLSVVGLWRACAGEL